MSTSVGTIVEVQARLQNNSPVQHTGTVIAIHNGCYTVRLCTEEVVRFNRYGICMPFQRQLQIKSCALLAEDRP
jgi:hypothetical protein